MSLQSIIGGMLIPSLPPFINAQPAFNDSFGLSISTAKIAFVVPIPKSGTLDKFEFKSGFMSLNSGSSIKVSLQGLNGYLPSGTAEQYRVINAADLSSLEWVAPELMTSDGTDTGVKRTVTRGEKIACVIEYNNFTAADFFNIRTLRIEDQAALRPCVAYFNASGSWTTPSDNGAIVSLKYDDGTYPNLYAGVAPITYMESEPIVSGSEIGVSFSLPAPVRIGGVVFRIKLAGACDVILYDDQSNALRTVSLAADTIKPTSSYQLIVFPTTIDDQEQPRSGDIHLAANVNYRCVIKPRASGVEIDTFYTESEEIMNAMPMGTNMRYTARPSGGDWVDVSTVRPWFGLFVTAIDHDTSGGSGGGGFEGDL